MKIDLVVDSKAKASKENRKLHHAARSLAEIEKTHGALKFEVRNPISGELNEISLEHLSGKDRDDTVVAIGFEPDTPEDNLALLAKMGVPAKYEGKPGKKP
jgi:hypothetical protein